MIIRESTLGYNSGHGKVKIIVQTDPLLNTSYRVFVDGKEKIRAITSMHLNEDKILGSVQRIYPKK